MRMLRWARGKTRLDHVRNVDVWKEAHMYPMAEFLGEKRLRCFGHVQRWDKDDATRKTLQMAVDGKWNWGRPKLRWRELMKEDMARNQMKTEMAEDRKHWHDHDPSRHTTKFKLQRRIVEKYCIITSYFHLLLISLSSIELILSHLPREKGLQWEV